MNEKQIENLAARFGWLKYNELPVGDVGQSQAIQGRVAAILEHAAAMGAAFEANDVAGGLRVLARVVGQADALADAIIRDLDAIEKERREHAAPLFEQASRLIFAVGADIDARKGRLRMREALAGEEAQRRRDAGLSDSQIAAIGSAWPESERQRIEAEIAELEAERTALGAFVADDPRFDLGLLDNTRLAQATEPPALAG